MKIGKLNIPFRRITVSTSYIPEIDGLRFIAIMMVVLHHLVGIWIIKSGNVYGHTFVNDLFYQAVSHWGQGVRLFFVISGFILGYPFAKHYLAGGKKIKLKDFYLRRVTRLEPPYVVSMLMFYVVSDVIGKYSMAESFPNLIASIFYVHNFAYGTGSIINNVAWSLEVEIQFYILAPVFCMVYRLSKTYRRLILIGMIILVPLLRPVLEGGPENLLQQLNYFLSGLLLADFFVCDQDFFKVKSSFYDFSALVVLLAICYVADRGYTPRLNSLLYMLLFVSAFKGPVFGKMMSFSFVATVGGMCYSIYLLHGRFISLPLSFGLQKMFYSGNLLLDTLVVALVILPLMLVGCSAFYLLIERPCMDKNWPKKLVAWFGSVFSFSRKTA